LFYDVVCKHRPIKGRTRNGGVRQMALLVRADQTTEADDWMNVYFDPTSHSAHWNSPIENVCPEMIADAEESPAVQRRMLPLHGNNARR
jgi:hypothetical protein